MNLKLATLAVAASFLAHTADAQSWNVEGFGGLRFDDELTYNGVSFDTDRGSAYGLRVLYNGFAPGLSFGLEVNATQAGYSGFLTSINSQAVMAIARYTFAQNNGFEAYVTGGMGSINVEYDGSTQFPAFTGEDRVAGGQLSLGAAYAITPSTAVFGEIMMQRAFEDAMIVGIPVEYSSTNLLLGIRLSF